MARGTRIEIRGLKEAQRAFARLPDVARETWNELAIEPTLKAIAQQAKQNLQASPSIRTGSLLRAIGWSLDRRTGQGKAGIERVSTTIAIPGRRRGVRVRGIVVPGRGGSALMSQGARVIRPGRYGHLVEFGHAGRRAARPEPFMRPAAASQESAFLARSRAVGPVLERRMAGGGAASAGGTGLL